ncbi:DUF2188 domain-containing protein [Chelativorans sp.]|uniref:DUF2188 domain-containing protein n=1 Tax=Chelativorans sp. TaxID=2203393 RepID=UPI002810DBEC|nr:DUF2188 domain-containing protein [Chelativorans sp.]
MRFVIAALGAYGLYRLFRRSHRGPRALLQDMRTRPDGQRRDARGDDQSPRRITYEVVEHDGGWAYKVGDVFSEAFATRQEATRAAEQAAAAHASAGSDEAIQYQDRDGRWHEEMESGDSRPETRVEPASRH